MTAKNSWPERSSGGGGTTRSSWIPHPTGRGPGGEVWKLEEKIYSLLELTTKVLSDDPLFFALNSYTTGLSASVMAYLLELTINRRFPGVVTADEIGLPVKETGTYFALWLHRFVAEEKGRGEGEKR